MTTDTLVTVATFADRMQADIARNDLQAAGIKVFLVGETFAAVAWHLTNAAHGIRLQVPGGDVERAREILSDPAQYFVGDAANEASSAADAGLGEQQAVDGIDKETSKEDEPTEELFDPTLRDELAERAFRSAGLGLFFLPLELYTIWLLLKVVAMEDRLSRRSRNRALVACLIAMPPVLFVLFCEALLFAEKVIPRFDLLWFLQGGY